MRLISVYIFFVFQLQFLYCQNIEEKYDYAIYEIQTIPTIDTLSVKYYDNSDKILIEKVNYHYDLVNYYRYDAKNRVVEVTAKDLNNKIQILQSYKYSDNFIIIKEKNFLNNNSKEYWFELLSNHNDKALNKTIFMFCCGDTINPDEVQSIHFDYDSNQKVRCVWDSESEIFNYVDFFENDTLLRETIEMYDYNKVDAICEVTFDKVNKIKTKEIFSFSNERKTKKIEYFDDKNNLLRTEYVEPLKTDTTKIEDTYKQKDPISSLPNKVVIISKVSAK